MPYGGRGGSMAELYPRVLGWFAFSHGWPCFLLQLTCVRVGDVCNKGKVRRAKLFPAVSVGHVGGVQEIRVMSRAECGGGHIVGAVSPGSAFAHRVLAPVFLNCSSVYK